MDIYIWREKKVLECMSCLEEAQQYRQELHKRGHPLTICVGNDLDSMTKKSIGTSSGGQVSFIV